MAKSNWWTGAAAERYWLESTDRQDVGTDLRAPTLDDSGRPNWRYLLFQDARPGDIVFHYHKGSEAIIGASRVAGPPFDRPIVWGARGTFARAKGVKPHERPGYVVPLEGYSRLATPLTLRQLRDSKPLLDELLTRLEARHPKRALYFPFEIRSGRALRPLQGYAFKLPQAFVAAFPELQTSGLVDASEPSAGSAIQVVAPTRGGQGFGLPLDERLAVEAHAMSEAGKLFASLGYAVEDVSRTRPYDLAVTRGSEALTVEVKGSTGPASSVLLTRNEVDHTLASNGRAVLFVLHSIELDRTGVAPKGIGGVPQIHWPWVLHGAALEPLQFKYTLPAPNWPLESSMD